MRFAQLGWKLARFNEPHVGLDLGDVRQEFESSLDLILTHLHRVDDRHVVAS
ncbi:MAG: hypothetical protein ACI8TQ_000048 [Planctomycetota bacterium]|jgi:hypothetical protein